MSEFCVVVIDLPPKRFVVVALISCSDRTTVAAIPTLRTSRTNLVPRLCVLRHFTYNLQQMYVCSSQTAFPDRTCASERSPGGLTARRTFTSNR